jgi:heme oxygenase-like protein
MSSSLHLELFERPRFREQVELVFDDDGVECVYRDQSCRVDFHGNGDARQLITLLREGGLTREELQGALPALAGDIGGVLTALDALGLLTETHLSEPGGVVSGRQLYRELRRMADNLYNEVIDESFYQRMTDGTISAHQLIGYALEYYHLVHLAPRLLAPALSKEEPGRIPGLLQDFLASELHHDRMLESALGAVGITSEQLAAAQPLPMTFGLCAGLGAYAAQNPLTFKAMLYLFEEPSPDFNDAFATACRAAGLPEGFIAPILAHAHLNSDGNHGDISGELLAEVPVVGPEEQHTARKHLAITVETMALQEKEILAYYGAPGALIPRVYT